MSSSPVNLLCDSLVNPLGMDNPSPRFSWQSASTRPGWMQGAYRVVCSTTSTPWQCPDVWDSGKVASGASVNIRYAGKALMSRQRVTWAVKVWDEAGVEGDWSAPVWFEMGLLKAKDWKAQWVSRDRDFNETNRVSPLLRRTFTLPAGDGIAKARMYVSGLGFANVYVNGQKVSGDVLSPLVTHYDRRVLYSTYDIAPLLHEGENVVGIELGNGWYNPNYEDVWFFRAVGWRDISKAICQVEVVTASGKKKTVASDVQWKTAEGPVTFNALRNGEFYDARLEKSGWNAPGYSARGWAGAVVARHPGGVMNAQMLPVRVMKTLKPIGIKEVEPGVFVLDLGQNMAGWVRLRVSGPAGTTVKLKYAEKVYENGDIDSRNIEPFVKGGEFQTDQYTLKGDGEEIWEPSFAYHGFRWVRITGFPETPTLDNFEGRVVHSAFESAGRFECSSDVFNWIQGATRWAYIGNFVGLPTDCPHREKNGWTGDASLACETGLFNYAAAPAYRKWIRDFTDVQRPVGSLPGIVPSGGWGFNWGSGPAWDAAFWHIPWMMYLYRGETQLLEDYYPAMKRHVSYIASLATDDIVEFGLGDWCPANEQYDQYATPAALTNTGYYYAECKVLEAIATLLGKASDAKAFRKQAANIYKAFNTTFYDSATGRYEGNTATAMGCALYQGLVPETERIKVVDALLAAIHRDKDHLTSGILGAKYIPTVLAAHGHAQLAATMLTQPDFPSYAHWRSMGATTLWEQWSGEASRNHIMFGDVSAWMFKTLAGITPDPAAPGFKRVRICPNFVEGLEWVDAAHESPYGTIAVSWKRNGATVELSISLPPNTSGTLALPSGFALDGGATLVDLASGKKLWRVARAR